MLKTRKNQIIIGVVVLGLFILLFGRVLVKGIPFLYELFAKSEIELKQENKNDPINILLLGRGGGTHEGPDLTDTILFANIDPKHNAVNLFSIPRDLWAEDLKAKINTAYAYGQERDKQGKTLARAVVEKLTGQKVDYVLVLDFSGFVKLVDYLGGIEVDVRRGFDDYQYPVEGKENDLCGHQEEELETLLASASSELEVFPCRYKHISFKKGVQHMNGKTALEFVRSRYATGGEGNDFSRSKRQQDVINAIRSKVLSLGILLNPVKVIGIYNILMENIDTDIKEQEYDDFIKLSRSMENAKINSYVIAESDEMAKNYGLLKNPEPSEEYKFQWVLIPRAGNGNYTEIAKYITCIESGKVCLITRTGIESKEITKVKSSN